MKSADGTHPLFAEATKEVERPSNPVGRPFMPFPPERAPHSNEVEQPAPPMRKVERRPDGVVVTLHINGQYLVERLRDNGTTYAGSFYTRAELEQLRDGLTEILR